LIWINFAHLFLVALVPFATAWIARTRLASAPVAFYADLFVCVDVAYNVFEREVLAGAKTVQVSHRARRMARAAFPRRAGDLRERHRGGIRRTARRVRPRARRFGPSRSAGSTRSSCMTVGRLPFWKLPFARRHRTLNHHVRDRPERLEQRWDFHGSRGHWGVIPMDGFSRQARCPSGWSSRSHCGAE
jgi:hypothetical protein